MEKQVHILIVEDDNDISGLLCNMMKKKWICPSAGIFRDGSNIVRGEKEMRYGVVGFNAARNGRGGSSS
jgi:DNA-binding NtrC family response regulator